MPTGNFSDKMRGMDSDQTKTRRSKLDAITPEELADYHIRRLSPAQLAGKYGLTAKWVRLALPKRAPARTEKLRSELRAARAEFRNHLAVRVARGELTTEEAANTCHCSRRTMQRYALEAKKRLQNA